MKGLWNYLKDLETTHRATRGALIKQGKAYRSRLVAYENGYLNALADILAIMEQPEKETALREAMNKLIEKRD